MAPIDGYYLMSHFDGHELVLKKRKINLHLRVAHRLRGAGAIKRFMPT